jgi:capsular polysaccharide biosynthesis protein
MEKEIFGRVAQNIAKVKKPNPKRRLFLSRRAVTRESGGTYRALLNEEALVAAFSDRGYSIVEPELLPLEDQIRAFSEAELIVGLGGAAFFNTVFSPPGTRIVSIESSTNFAHDHACLFGSLGHRFGFIFGRQDSEDETPIQKRWTIDVDGVIKTIKAYE